MKARIKKTGEIVNIAEYARITLEQCNSWGNPVEVKPEDIELIQETTEEDRWQDVRERAAIAALQGILACKIKVNTQIYVQYAVAYADALVAELKKKSFVNNE